MKIQSYIMALVMLAALVVSSVLAQHPAGHSGMEKKEQEKKMATAPYDLQFIDMMLKHHQMGIEMAQMAQNKASHAELKELATKMVEKQQKGSDQLKQWRDEWYAGQPKADHMKMSEMAGMAEMSEKSKSDHPPKSEMSGMKMQEMNRSKLEAATGKEFDLLFIDLIVPHHQMAIAMSEKALKKAEHAPLKTFARTTIEEQQKEVKQLNQWKAAWGGK
ncbi:MAG: DUF305 domain-containing protein [Acidobacteria bacterium]|nr:DUF305 domain-containing protein [Acidobacteriota bacterium]